MVQIHNNNGFNQIYSIWLHNKLPVLISPTRKAPGALDPAVVLPPPPRGVKYVTVTQDKSPCLCSERHDEYLFGRAKTGGLGQLTTKKKTTEKKWVLLDPVLTAG